MTRVTIETGATFALFGVRRLFDHGRRICGGQRSARVGEGMAAHVLFDGVPDRGGVPLSTFRAECDDEPLMGLSDEFMIQYDGD